MTVDQIIRETLEKEGGYSNHPADKGGPTRYGITEHVARAYGYTGDMRNLPLVSATDIYKRQYWSAPGFGLVNMLLPKVAMELFDTGVNMGPQRAGKMLQRALNVLNGAGEFPNLGVDGAIGNMSIYALKQFIAKRGSANAEKVLMRLLEAQQACRYIEIAEGNASQEAFMYGWIANRVGDIV